VIIVDFRVRPGRRAAFRELIDANARASVANEPGCLRFDVLEPAGEKDRILLYEIYADRAAFEAHVGSEHFKAFDADSAAMTEAKSVVECELVCEGTG
jgi:quinol monooxygenase YgiN